MILILPFITVPYVSRVIGAEGIGTYSYTYSIAYYFMIIAMLGLNNYGNRTIAKARDDREGLSKTFCSIYTLQLIISFIMVVAYIVFILLFNMDYKNIAIIQIIYIISSMFDINWFFFGIEKFKVTITRNTIIKVVSLLLTFMLVKSSKDVWIYTLILAGSTLLSNLILFTTLHKYIDFVKVSKKDVFKHLKPNAILFLPVIAVSIYKILDKIMLGSISTITEVGYYENAEKITRVPLTIITALGTIMLPRVSNMIAKKEELKVKETLKKSMIFIMFITFPMILGLICISREFTILFLGQSFEKSGILVNYLSITILFLAWGNVIRTQYLIPKEKDKSYIISAIMGAVINFVMNMIFIPKLGAIGACYGTIAAEFLVMFYQTWIVRRELPIKKYVKDAVPFFIKALFMFCVIKSFNLIEINTTFRLILQIGGGCIIYVLLNLRYINKTIHIKDSFLKLVRKSS